MSIQEELDAVDAAQDTMTNLSTTIRDSFGLYLNKTASELIEGITGGIYRSMSIDQDLNMFMNTPAALSLLSRSTQRHNGPDTSGRPPGCCQACYR